MIYSTKPLVTAGILSSSSLDSIEGSDVSNSSTKLAEEILKQPHTLDQSKNLSRAAFAFHEEDDDSEILDEKEEPGNGSTAIDTEENRLSTAEPRVEASAAINIPLRSPMQGLPAAVAAATKVVAQQKLKSPVVISKTRQNQPVEVVVKQTVMPVASSQQVTRDDDDLEDKVRGYKEGVYRTLESEADLHFWYENTGQEYFNTPSKTKAKAMCIPGGIPRERPEELIIQQPNNFRGNLPRRSNFTQAKSDAIKKLLMDE